MTRLIFLFVALNLALPSGFAARDYRKVEVAPGVKSVKGSDVPAPAPKQATSDHPELHISAQTEVFLDGRPCPYSAIPADAVIIYGEVAEDGKTLMLIRFRSAR